MPLLVNLRHLEREAQNLRGEIPAEELDIGDWDELIHAAKPLRYELTVERMGHGVLAQGRLELPLNCECARCLKPFARSVPLDRWAVLLPLEGDDKVLVVNDCVDLTPWIREDILLAFPQHPLCRPECSGLPEAQSSQGQMAGGTDAASAWAVLDKLKF